MEQRRVSRWRIDPLVVTGIVTVLGLIVLVLAYSIPLFRGFAPLQVVGGVLLGAGVSAWIGTATGREAIRQQSAREANLKRKTDTYGPLYDELKALRIAFAQARAGAAPAPQWIDDGVGVERKGIAITLSSEADPTLLRWPEYRRGYRDTDFKAPTKRLLDDLQMLATTYNNAVEAAREPAISILASHADVAIAELRQSESYRQWQQQQAVLKANPVPTGHEPKTEHGWYGYIDSTDTMFAAPQGRTPGQLLADMWLTHWPAATLQLSYALGWLLAAQSDKAASYVQSNYPAMSMTSPPPPLDWIQGIFMGAWPELQQDQAFRDAGATGESLFQRVQAAEAVLETGLRDIQNLYEGGEPLV